MGETRATDVSSLQQWKRIPRRHLSRNDSEEVTVKSLCALSADELLLACGTAGLRALSLRTGQLVAREPTAMREDVRSVAYDRQTDTLLLVVCVWQSEWVGKYQLVSLCRNASEWHEVQRLNLKLYELNAKIFMEVCDSRVLLGQWGGNALYSFDLSAKHTLQDADKAHLLESRGFACTRRGNDTLVALPQWPSVSLQQLATHPLQHLKQLATSDVLTSPQFVLFRGELLLVADWNFDTKTHAIVSLHQMGNALAEQRVLLEAKRSVNVNFWTLSGDRLVVSEWNEMARKSGDLYVYDFA